MFFWSILGGAIVGKWVGKRILKIPRALAKAILKLFKTKEPTPQAKVHRG